MRAAYGGMGDRGEESPRTEAHTVRVLSRRAGRMRSSKPATRETEVGNGARWGVPRAEVFEL